MTGKADQPGQLRVKATTRAVEMGQRKPGERLGSRCAHPGPRFALLTTRDQVLAPTRREIAVDAPRSENCSHFRRSVRRCSATLTVRAIRGQIGQSLTGPGQWHLAARSASRNAWSMIFEHGEFWTLAGTAGPVLGSCIEVRRVQEGARRTVAWAATVHATVKETHPDSVERVVMRAEIVVHAWRFQDRSRQWSGHDARSRGWAGRQ